MSQHTNCYQASPGAGSPAKSEQTMASPHTATGGVVLMPDDAGGREVRYQRRLVSHIQPAGASIGWRLADD
jgi:hypothetical protein